jgi:competence protein ComEC
MAAWLALGLAWALSLRPAPAHRPQRLELYFLDVGQGDCQVAVFPDGTGLLVDGGGGFLSDFPVGRRLVLPFLLQRGIRVKWLAVTHFHPDHVSGAVDLAPILRPEEIWIGSAPRTNAYYRRLIAAAGQRSRIVEVAAGFRRRVAGCTVEALHPPRFGGGGPGENNRSLVLRIADGSHAFLLTGDIEAAVEAELVGSGPPLLRADVLKVAHHGSGRSSSRPFIAAVSPELAVISCAEANAYGFPHRRVLAELRRRGVPWLGTGRRGGILVRSEPGRLHIEVSR